MMKGQIGLGFIAIILASVFAIGFFGVAEGIKNQGSKMWIEVPMYDASFEDFPNNDTTDGYWTIVDYVDGTGIYLVEGNASDGSKSMLINSTKLGGNNERLKYVHGSDLFPYSFGLHIPRKLVFDININNISSVLCDAMNENQVGGKVGNLDDGSGTFSLAWNDTAVEQDVECWNWAGTSNITITTLTGGWKRISAISLVEDDRVIQEITTIESIGNWNGDFVSYSLIDNFHAYYEGEGGGVQLDFATYTLVSVAQIIFLLLPVFVAYYVMKGSLGD